MCCKKVDTTDHGTVDAEAMFKTEMDQVMSLPDPMASVEAYLPANLSGLTPANNSPDRFSFMQSAKKEKVMSIFPLLNSLSIAILFFYFPLCFHYPNCSTSILCAAMMGKQLSNSMMLLSWLRLSRRSLRSEPLHYIRSIDALVYLSNISSFPLISCLMRRPHDNKSDLP